VSMQPRVQTPALVNASFVGSQSVYPYQSPSNLTQSFTNFNSNHVSQCNSTVYPNSVRTGVRSQAYMISETVIPLSKISLKPRQGRHFVQKTRYFSRKRKTSSEQVPLARYKVVGNNITFYEEVYPLSALKEKQDWKNSKQKNSKENFKESEEGKSSTRVAKQNPKKFDPIKPSTPVSQTSEKIPKSKSFSKSESTNSIKKEMKL
jgi:hypothetical protein